MGEVASVAGDVGDVATISEEVGGLNLFKFDSPQATTPKGWSTGDRFLNLPDQGSPKLNWAQNYGALRGEMQLGNPIYDSYLKADGSLSETRGFLNAERYTLRTRGWTFDEGMGAWTSPQ